MDRRSALKRTGLMAGAALALPTALSLLQSCQNEKRPDWKPEFLTASEAALVAALVDTVLPRTETPGGLDVKADMFMDKVFARVYDPEAREALRRELAAFDSRCIDGYGEVFAELGDTDRASVLKAEEAAGGKFNPGVWGTAVGEQEPVGFYRNLKSMMVWAYFSSEEIGRNVLSYDPIPGAFQGCIPLSDVGNRWSL
ncbi:MULTISPECIES: gluconate 2-dehydrogenase subunit 3 family protein [unclassified Robiginitalea]|mgnify:CR=1 FL=1|uniref:gluconate 2-dehydrogenase subunit 3 family protein n=1 Tax=Robiginitalea TaxID=252306 RepID=UPI00234BFB48|nr:MULTISPECIES: gluconate 2-dehydrogenase subunit 3 family protein [unclassified Robiginitalea]MDC6354597.1 gluconate 2-dehydrogenase subunit 3 family protein [Robiginitalea sp. PM2]MDC6374721.1 gluconate 2-dehydrogenase subunit 3 family protein [Robiginitalea sp. SP8]